MKPIPKFIYGTHPDLTQALIIDTKTLLMGSVWLLKDEPSFYDYLNRYHGPMFCEIKGYTIVITFYGKLTEYPIVPQYHLKDIFAGMADFFLNEKVKQKPRLYKRYIIENPIKPNYEPR